MQIPVNYKHQQSGAKWAAVFLRASGSIDGSHSTQREGELVKQMVDIVNAQEGLGIKIAGYELGNAQHRGGTRRQLRAFLNRIHSYGISTLVVASPEVLSSNWIERRLLQAELWTRGFDLITVAK